MGTFHIELIQMDLINPESFIYRVFADNKFVAGFESLERANAFIVAHGGEPVEVRVWRKGIQAKAD